MSMMGPETYKMSLEGASLKDLVRQRRELINSLYEYEDAHIFGDEEVFSIMKPSPETRYSMNNEYLKEITDLIEKKRKQLYMEKIRKSLE